MSLCPRRCEKIMCGNFVMDSDSRYCSEHSSKFKMTERNQSPSFAVGGIEPESKDHNPYPDVSVDHEGQHINVDALIYVSGLEHEVARLKNKCTVYRRECRRLNEQVKHTRSLEAEILVLRLLLDREDDENKVDTDPSQLGPDDPALADRGLQETFDEWDMRTRFSSGGPRT